MSGIILEKLLIMMIMGLIGFICGKTGLIDGDTNKKLSNLSLLVVNPLLIFVSYQMPYSGDIALNLGIVFLFSVFAFVIQLGAALLLVREKDNPNVGVERMSLAFSNNGYIGIPHLHDYVCHRVQYCSVDGGCSVYDGQNQLPAGNKEPVFSCYFYGAAWSCLFLLQNFSSRNHITAVGIGRKYEHPVCNADCRRNAGRVQSAGVHQKAEAVSFVISKAFADPGIDCAGNGRLCTVGCGFHADHDNSNCRCLSYRSCLHHVCSSVSEGQRLRFGVVCRYNDFIGSNDSRCDLVIEFIIKTVCSLI